MSQNTLQKIGIILSMISVIAVILGIKIVTTKMDTIAASQFGGAENYAIAQKLFSSEGFKSQQKTQLESALKSMDGAAATADQDTPAQNNNQAQDPTSTFPSGKLTTEQLAALRKDAYVEGDANAKVTIVEYSDLECPYCIRHFNEKTIQTVVSAFPGSVNHIFKVVQGVNHQGTEYKSLATLCAGKLGGDKSFVSMYQNIFASSTQQAPVANAKIAEFATAAGLDAAKLENCIKNGDTKSIYAANWAEFKTFTNSPGTPGNIVVNNETEEWKLIAGAYPADTFKQVISAWVK